MIQSSFVLDLYTLILLPSACTSGIFILLFSSKPINFDKNLPKDFTQPFAFKPPFLCLSPVCCLFGTKLSNIAIHSNAAKLTVMHTFLMAREFHAPQTSDSNPASSRLDGRRYQVALPAFVCRTRGIASSVSPQRQTPRQDH